MLRSRTVLAIAVALLAPLAAAAEEVRYYQQDGVTYKETRRVCQRSVSQVEWQERNQTVYRSEPVTETRDVVRSYAVPITEYRAEAYWVGRWNPFVQPYLATRYVPKTYMEQRTEVTPQTVTTCRTVPETHTVKVPVVVQRVVPEEIVSRVAVGPAVGAPSAANVALEPVPSEPIGGVARLQNDPPRQGTGTAWRPSTTLR